MANVRRPWTTLTATGTAAHHGFELLNGIGLVWQPELGLAGSGALWTTHVPFWLVLAQRGGKRFERLLAVMSGISFGGVVVHFLIWPWRRTRAGLPVLIDAEGMPSSKLPAYNAILYLWGIASVLSLRELTPRARPWALLGLVALPILRRSAMHHFSWLHDQAATNPAWWNRGVQGQVDSDRLSTTTGISRLPSTRVS